MKNLFYFLSGIFLIILTSATTVQIITVKPIVPKSVVQAKSFEEAKNYIKQGYIIKVATGYSTYYILEKY